MTLAWRGRRGWRVLVVLLLAFALWGGNDRVEAQLTGQTIREFEVPEFDRDNRLRYRLFGEFARILDNGAVDITEMRVDFYDADRQVEMRVTADHCVYNRQRRQAESEGPIRIARDNMVITGKGFSWQADDGRFEIHQDAKVVFRDRRAVAEHQTRPAKPEEEDTP